MVRKLATLAALGLAIVLTPVAVLILYGFWGNYQYLLIPSERHLNQRIEQAIKAKRLNVPLKELTDFEWNEVCTFLSYNTPDEQNPALKGYTLRGRIPDVDNDGQWALLFKNFTTHVARFVEMKQTFDRKQKEGCYSHNSLVHVHTIELSWQGKVATYPALLISE